MVVAVSRHQLVPTEGENEARVRPNFGASRALSTRKQLSRGHLPQGLNINSGCLNFKPLPRLNITSASGPSQYRLRARCGSAASSPYCTALIMSKIGRYIATTMPPTTTPRNTIMIGSSSESKPPTAASTSSS